MTKKYWIVVLVVVVLGGLFWYFNSSLPVTINSNLELVTKTDSWKNFSEKDIGLSFSYPENWGNPKVEKSTDYFSITFPETKAGYGTSGTPSIHGQSPNYQSDVTDLSCTRIKDREIKPGEFLSYRIISRGDGIPMGIFSTNLNKKYPDICASVDFLSFLDSFQKGSQGYFTINDFNENNLKKLFLLEQQEITDFEKFVESFKTIN